MRLSQRNDFHYQIELWGKSGARGSKPLSWRKSTGGWRRLERKEGVSVSDYTHLTEWNFYFCCGEGAGVAFAYVTQHQGTGSASATQQLTDAKY
jgi:hypothetical protein